MNKTEIQRLLDGGNLSEAVGALLETIADLTDRVNTWEIELETLVDSLAPDPDDYPFDEDCETYVVTCPHCQCRLEVPAELLEDEESSQSLICPECGEPLDI